MRKKEIEQEAEKKLREGVKNLGGKAYKFVSPGNSGVPDRIVILPGLAPIFVELKKPGEEPRKLQKVQIRTLKRLGQDVRVLHGKEEVEKFLEEVSGDGIYTARIPTALH